MLYLLVGTNATKQVLQPVSEDRCQGASEDAVTAMLPNQTFDALRDQSQRWSRLQGCWRWASLRSRSKATDGCWGRAETQRATTRQLSLTMFGYGNMIAGYWFSGMFARTMSTRSDGGSTRHLQQTRSIGDNLRPNKGDQSVLVNPHLSGVASAGTSGEYDIRSLTNSRKYVVQLRPTYKQGNFIDRARWTDDYFAMPGRCSDLPETPVDIRVIAGDSRLKVSWNSCQGMVNHIRWREVVAGVAGRWGNHVDVGIGRIVRNSKFEERFSSTTCNCVLFSRIRRA